MDARLLLHCPQLHQHLLCGALALQSPGYSADTGAVILKRFSQNFHLLLVPNAPLALVPGQLADSVVPVLRRHALLRPSCGHCDRLVALLLQLAVVGPGVLEHAADLGIVLLKTSLN